MSEWQPIETAPKDGSHFLAYGDGMMVVGHIHGSGTKYEYFTLSYECGWESECELTDPTHWMPLPEPPK